MIQVFLIPATFLTVPNKRVQEVLSVFRRYSCFQPLKKIKKIQIVHFTLSYGCEK